MPTDNFNQKLIARLKTDRRFVDNAGEFIPAAAKDSAWKLDIALIKHLLSEPECKAKFFTEIDGHWIFNYNAFITYLSDKNFLADAYTRFRNKIGLNIDEKFLPERGEVALVWPYKDCVLEGGQTREEEKRTEVFFNELLAPDEINRLLAPKVLTNWKRHTAASAQPVAAIERDTTGTIRENLLVKGNNLLALHSLKLQFRGKVKCVYIDPPYNTGGAADSFTYNNTFNHSTWLTFMRNRLEVAKELLREDGMITVAINDAELFYLGVLLDEVFGRENKIGVLCIRHHPRGTTQSRFFSTVHEYALIYAKDAKRIQEDFRFETTDEIEEESFVRAREDATPDTRPSLYYPIFYNPTTQEITLKDGGEDFVKLLPMGKNGMRTWKLIRESFLEELNEGKIYVRKVGSEYKVYRKIIRKKNKAKTMWTDARYDANHHGTGLLKKMFDGRNLFSYPKSLYTVMDILKLTTNAGDIIVDFFAGSGTTGHAVVELNRRGRGGATGSLSSSSNWKSMSLSAQSGLKRSSRKRDLSRLIFSLVN